MGDSLVFKAEECLDWRLESSQASQKLLNPMEQLSSNFDKVILAAQLSDFAYTSADPSDSISKVDSEAEKKLYSSLSAWGSVPHAIGGRTGEQERPSRYFRFASHSWFRSKETQFRWLRSHAYVYDYFEEWRNAEPSNVHRIVVAFRGTWNNSERPPVWYTNTDQRSRPWPKRALSAVGNWLATFLTPANRGYSDFYYDATLIRIPYTTGTVWKWFAYWGALILERTSGSLLSWVFYPARKVAADWISRPNHNRTAAPASDDAQFGDVHLGFWSLWASPEGFAGYDVDGDLRKVDPGAIRKVRDALDNCRGANKATEIMIVGHSLGGAVSCFAALDIARRLKEWGREDVSIFHCTFGAPPVGDPRFQAHFNAQFNTSTRKNWESWSIFHERDAVASCFAWCGSKWLLGRLNWWGDWRGVGQRIRLTRQCELPEPANALAPPVHAPLQHATFLSKIQRGLLDCGKWLLAKTGITWLRKWLRDNFIERGLIIVLLLLILVLWLLSWLAVLIAFRYYLSPWYWCFRRKHVTEPSAEWGCGRKARDPLPEPQRLNFEYHSLQRYIALIKQDRFQNHATMVGWDNERGEVPV